MTLRGLGQHRDPRGRLYLAAWRVRRRPKRVSAMIRVRNEREFLAAAVHSIAALVDELVLIDNGSTDATPEIIRTLVRELPNARAVSYPFEVARAGRENLEAVRNADGPAHHRLSTYYNWALRQCRCPFVLKWDGDMVATDELVSAWEAWRSGPFIAMSFKGANVHPDGAHLLGARNEDPTVVGRELASGVVPKWILQMTYTDTEPRLFPRFLAHYDDGLWWCERLYTPFGYGPFAERQRLEPAAPLYLHLNFCKRSPHANHSPDIAAVVQGNIAVGPPLPDAWRRAVNHVDFRSAG